MNGTPKKSDGNCVFPLCSDDFERDPIRRVPRGRCPCTDHITSYCSDILVAMDERTRAAREVDEMQSQGVTLEWGLCRRSRLAEHRLSRLRWLAAENFAKLNRWMRSHRSFTLAMLARASSKSRWDEYLNLAPKHHLLDHPIYFRDPVRPFRPAAIVGQPYNTDPEKARAEAEAMGLTMVWPEDPSASWWYPGATRFFCFVRPNTNVRFLPDQGEPAGLRQAPVMGTPGIGILCPFNPSRMRPGRSH